MYFLMKKLYYFSVLTQHLHTTLACLQLFTDISCFNTKNVFVAIPNSFFNKRKKMAANKKINKFIKLNEQQLKIKVNAKFMLIVV